ncbi:GlcG/HbpS family heme-binding protein [Endothiovibrio diazotrophicus]
MKKRVFAALLGLAVVAGTPAQAEERMVVSIQRMTMETALAIAKGAIEACRAKGIQIGVTVVDRGGNPQVMLRDVLAPDLTIDISRKKAYTAMSFMAATSALVGRFPGSYGVGKHEPLLVSAGGLPVQAGGVFLGGVGVSGAPGGEIDEACAQAGIDAVAADLEMGM